MTKPLCTFVLHVLLCVSRVLGQDSSPVTLSPAAVSFSAQVVGTTSAAKTLTLTNKQSTAMTINRIVASGGFNQTNTCGGSVAAGESCTISLTFSPSTTGTLFGSLTIIDSASTGPQLVNLSGTGVLPVTLSPSIVAFGNQSISTRWAFSQLLVRPLFSLPSNYSA